MQGYALVKNVVNTMFAYTRGGRQRRMHDKGVNSTENY
jgi:hypothetical protein